MCRTTLNVTGDLVLATVVSRGESDDIVPADAPEPVAPGV
jgi:DAACS family dicarboxylate/amino acid:cation (Na+ or H+) symporter